MWFRSDEIYPHDCRWFKAFLSPTMHKMVVCMHLVSYVIKVWLSFTIAN